MMVWGPDHDAALKRALAQARSDGEAAGLLTEWFGFRVTKDAVHKRRTRLRLAAKTHGTRIARDTFAHRPTAAEPEIEIDTSDFDVLPRPSAAQEPMAPEERRAVAAEHARFERLVLLVRKYKTSGGLTLEVLCDELGLTPRQGRALVEDAIDAGYSLDVIEGALEYRASQPSRHEVVFPTHPYEPGAQLVAGVASDLHICSKHHENDALRRHIDWLLESGVRHTFVPGDLVAGGGRYKFLRFEVTQTGIEDQAQQAAEFFATYPEMTWHAIAGNHCESFDVGIDAARMVRRVMHERGQTNFHYYGARGARVRLFDTRFELWHPGGSLAYALTYKTQRHIDATDPLDRPHVLLVGHYHQAITFRRGGVWSCLCGTFENGDSSFGRMIGGDVALGGWLLRWRLGGDGRIAEWEPVFREYPQTKMQWVAAQGIRDQVA